MVKLIVTVMGDNCTRFLDMCFESIIEADKIIFLWGMEDVKTKELFLEWQKKYPNKFELIEFFYDQKDLGQNGKSRNYYLQHLKENYPDDWALCLDADEVVHDLSKIKEFIQTATPTIYCVRMRHLIGDLAHEDSKAKIHWVLGRLFKIGEASYYPEVEHPVLQGTWKDKIPNNPNNLEVLKMAKVEAYRLMGFTDCTTIWHLSHVPNMWELKKKYDSHMKKSEIHTPEFLKEWYEHLLFGTYPTKKFDPIELPKVILDKFGINKDELYFRKRGLEHKHWIDAVHWRNYFKCKTSIEFGCGLGPRVFVMNQVGIDAHGIEISEYAVNNKLHKNITQRDLTKGIAVPDTFDLSIAYDVLEHIPYDKLNFVINELIAVSKKYILLSVPVLGDPNLLADPSHKIHEAKEWWIKQFTDKGLKHIPTPNHFLYKDQVLIFQNI